MPIPDATTTPPNRQQRHYVVSTDTTQLRVELSPFIPSPLPHSAVPSTPTRTRTPERAVLQPQSRENRFQNKTHRLLPTHRPSALSTDALRSRLGLWNDPLAMYVTSIKGCAVFRPWEALQMLLQEFTTYTPSKQIKRKGLSNVDAVDGFFLCNRTCI